MVSQPGLLLPVVLAFVAVALGTVSLVLLWDALRASAKRRLILNRLQPDQPRALDLVPGLLRQTVGSPAGWLELAASKVPRLRDVRFRLQQANVHWSLRTYLVLATSTAMTLGLAAYLSTRVMLLSILFAVLGLLLPDLFVRRRNQKRMRRFEEQFPQAIDLLARAIRAGHPLAAGIRMVAEEAPEPVAGEFRQAFEEQRFGLPFEDALLGLSERNALVDVRIFVTAVLIQREVGGNLAEILDKISETVRARFTIQRQVRVSTAQGRMTGYVLALLPIGAAAGFYIVVPEHVMMLFNESAGKFMLTTAVILQLVGYAWIRKIVKIEI